MGRPARTRLLEDAALVGQDWTDGPYYDEAEAAFDPQWRKLIWPFIRNVDFTVTVEVAAGHGRNSERLRHLADRLYLVDINETNTEFLRHRFADADNVTVIRNNGIDLDAITDGEATFVYCFDSMVHFDSDVVRAYLAEFHRVLRPGGHGFVHYSNYTGNPAGSYRDHPGWRNFMSRDLFEHYCAKEGLRPVRSRVFGRNLRRLQYANSEALTLFERAHQVVASNS